MKAKLLSKALVLVAVFGLAACSKPGEEKLPATSISAAIDWDDGSGSPTLDGTVIRLADVIIGATYSENCFSVQKVDGNQVYAIEVITTESIEGVYDVKDIVDVVGTVSSTDGRPQVIDAKLTWGTGGEEACKGKGALNYYADFTRPGWDYNINRSWSGRWTESTWQIASVPTIVEGEATTFHVTFPGENLDVDDIENYCIMDVHVPALNAEQAATVSEWASQFEVGDGVYLFAQVYFKDYVCLMLPYTSFRFQGTNAEVEITNVFETFAGAEAAVNTIINVDLPSFASDAVYSWVTDTTSYTTELEDGTEVPLAIVSANTKDAETALYDIIDANLETGYAGVKYEAEGWYLVDIGAVDEAGTIGYLFLNGTLNEVVDETTGEPGYELVDSTCQILVYPSSETAIVMEIIPLTVDVVVAGDAE